jgi:2-hydroxychromene-2-carboxylate isomerase
VSLPPALGTTFYFDLGSPYAYLAAERLAGERLTAAPAEPVAWQPVSLGALFKLAGRSSWSLGDPERRRAGIAEVERRAELYGLPPVRWPEPWPSNYLFAMRACTYAFQVGRGREFSLRAFRAAFQHGHDLGVPERVLELAGEVGLEPRQVGEATQDPEVKLALRTATEAAHEIGVFGVPTLAVGGELFWGDDRLEQATGMPI